MVQIRENWQKQLTSPIADAGLLRTDLTLSTVNLINLLGLKEIAP